ncbi:hypothetical protein LCGC14_1248170 [marine sediment metagenome]|uniref:Uncharacterized protein n=1 Tax=marine sediment metagenome TaxID=412755 RepID=A0A0F9L3U4_9ZZZZ
MKNSINLILYDSLRDVKVNGEFTGSIISKCQDKIIFSDNIKISDSKGILINQGLLIGFERKVNNMIAFSKKSDFLWENWKNSPLEYVVLIPEETMERYDQGQFSNDFPFTINLLHTAGLLLNDLKFGIDHLDFFKGEILKNPVSLIRNGIIVADRVVIDHNGDPVFYDCLIVGRDEKDELNISYETIINIDDKVVEFIIILGIEELKI